MARMRRDAWALTHEEGDWPRVLVAYEEAVHRLRQLDGSPTGRPGDPVGWGYLAAIHGRRAADGGPDTSDPLWCTCQHESWYFLPWHRLYLRAFELIVQQVLGDDSWSLPYWYALDPDDPATAVLPPAFRAADGPGGGANALRTAQRSQRMNDGLPLLDKELLDVQAGTVVAALNTARYSSPDGRATFGGGERSTPSFGGGELGLLEGVPHGSVHMLVGNDYVGGVAVRRGWMGSFYTAGLDPVFWLHHANVDRLWQAWLELGHAVPEADPAWADATFTFPDATGATVTWRLGDALDPAWLGYEYEVTAPPRGVVPAPVPGGPGPDLGLGAGAGVVAALPEPPPQVIGATQDVAIASPEPVDVALAAPTDQGLGLGDDAGGGADAGPVSLRIEQVTGTVAAAAYQVHVNLDDGEAPADHPELLAGVLSTFGVAEASQEDELHAGTGITAVFDITAVRDALAARGRWDPTTLRLRFTPVAPEADVPTPPGTPRPPADLRAGQVTILAG